jgi:GNAT superfamily N-acetyltransferase
VLIRPRHESDIAACSDLVRQVHAADRYPLHLPDNLTSFLVSPGAYGAWVADDGGTIAGHVMLHSHGLRSALEVAGGALGRSADQLGVVARLFVSPAARGRGTGRLLLGTAVAESAARGLWPVLDVDTGLTSAISLYESCGWVRAGKITVRFSDGSTLDEYVYVGGEPGSLSILRGRALLALT